MNRLANWMMRLYPSRWRARYGDELDALLADSGADARVVVDLFRGGMKMQFSTWPFGKLAVALGLAGVLLAGGLSFLIPNVYTSKAVMQITPAAISTTPVRAEISTSLNERVMQMQQNIFSRTSLAGMINNPRLMLYSDELREKPLEDVIDEMRRDVSINIVALPGALGRRASAFEISFSYPDRYKAQQTVQAIMEAFDAENIQPHTPEAPGTLVVLDSPSAPVLVRPQPGIVIFAGLLAGIAIAFTWRMVSRTGLAGRHFGMAAMSLALFCALTGFGLLKANLLGNQYRSAATLEWRGGTADTASYLFHEVTSRTSLSMIIQNPRLNLYRDQLMRTPLEDVIATMKQHIDVQGLNIAGGTAIELRFGYGEHDKVRPALAALVDSLIDANQRLNAGRNAAAPTEIVSSGENLETLDVPSLPMAPTYPNRYMMALTGGLAGIGVAVVVWTVRRRWKPEPEVPVDAAIG